MMASGEVVSAEGEENVYVKAIGGEEENVCVRVIVCVKENDVAESVGESLNGDAVDSSTDAVDSSGESRTAHAHHHGLSPG